MEILNSTSGETLADLMKEYGQPAIVDNEEPETKPSTPVSAGTTGNIDSAKQGGEQSGNWEGNPAYYQTGKKAGQKRPLGTTPKIAFVKNESDTSTVDGELITGALFLSMIDLLFPLLISALHNYFVKSGKIKAESMMLSKEQRKHLEPVADKVVKQIQLSAHPTTVLILTMLGLYGMQYAIARMEAKMKDRK